MRVWYYVWGMSLRRSAGDDQSDLTEDHIRRLHRQQYDMLQELQDLLCEPGERMRMKEGVGVSRRQGPRQHENGRCKVISVKESSWG